MAGKRCADNQLTSLNWDQEEEESAPIGFSRASDEELKRRPMKTAKRSGTTGSTGIIQKPFVPISTGLSTGLKIAPPLTSPTSHTSSKYVRKLCALNESVSKWISDHVAKNPCIDLTPIFEDYQKYLKEIEELNNKSVTESISSNNINDEDKENVEKMEENERATENGEEQASDNEAQDIQSKQEKVLVIDQPVDEDCLMEVRCKLFYKKQEQFVELGIGKLRVEKLEDGVVRLLLRNDTSLGQILLNVRLTGSVPIMLQKNSVLLVCVPNPPLESKSPTKENEMPTTPTPVTYLLRVKDVHLSNKLHSTIKDNL